MFGLKKKHIIMYTHIRYNLKENFKKVPKTENKNVNSLNVKFIFMPPLPPPLLLSTPLPPLLPLPTLFLPPPHLPPPSPPGLVL